ncbi:MAG: alpha/beta hydrolase-fold protein [Planctomycetota bacterium]
MAEPGFEKDSVRPRFVSRFYTSPAGRRVGYLVFEPSPKVAEPHPPLLLFLNGLGQNGEDGIRQISNNFGHDVWLRRHVMPFVIVAPQARDGWGPGSPDSAAAMAILDLVEKEYGTDPDRLVVTGVSAGGYGAWDLASRFPERFAAVVPVCPGGGCRPETMAKVPVPSWSFYNEGDNPALVTWNRDNHAALVAAGLSPLSTEYEASGHNSWEAAYRTPALYAWLADRNRAQRQVFEPVATGELLRSWRPVGSADWSQLEPADEALGSPTGSGQHALVSPVLDNSFAIHLEVKTAGNTRRAVLGLYAEQGDRPLATLVLGKPDSDKTSFFIGNLPVPFDIGARKQLSAGRWNDLRIAGSPGRLRLDIGGWKAIDMPLPSELAAVRRVGLFTDNGSEIFDEPPVAWRYVRWRQITDGEAFR